MIAAARDLAALARLCAAQKRKIERLRELKGKLDLDVMVEMCRENELRLITYWQQEIMWH